MPRNQLKKGNYVYCRCFEGCCDGVTGALYRRHCNKKDSLSCLKAGEEVVELIPLKCGSYAESVVEDEVRIKNAVLGAEFASIVDVRLMR